MNVLQELNKNLPTTSWKHEPQAIERMSKRPMTPSLTKQSLHFQTSPQPVDSIIPTSTDKIRKKRVHDKFQSLLYEYPMASSHSADIKKHIDSLHVAETIEVDMLKEEDLHERLQR